MRVLRYPLIFVIAAGVTGLIAGYWEILAQPEKTVAAVLRETYLVARPTSSLGIIASLTCSVLAFFYVVLTQNRRKAGQVRRYRRAEQRLMEMGKMKREEILEYHRSYNWHAYAGLGFSTVFIIVPLYLEGKFDELGARDNFAVLLGLGMLGVATVVLGIIDLFHTNTLTPLITIERRFMLIDLILKLGGLALMLQVCAVGVFLSLINSWLSVVTSLFSLWLMILITERRGIPTESLVAEWKLTPEEAEIVEKA